MEKNREEKKYVLVTGGSSGIGMELSKLLAKDGNEKEKIEIIHG